MVGNEVNDHINITLGNVKDIWNDKYLDKWTGYSVPAQSNRTFLELFNFVNNELFDNRYHTYEEIWEYLECSTCSMNPDYKWNHY